MDKRFAGHSLVVLLAVRMRVAPWPDPLGSAKDIVVQLVPSASVEQSASLLIVESSAWWATYQPDPRMRLGGTGATDDRRGSWGREKPTRHLVLETVKFS